MKKKLSFDVILKMVIALASALLGALSDNAINIKG